MIFAFLKIAHKKNIDSLVTILHMRCFFLLLSFKKIWVLDTLFIIF